MYTKNSLLVQRQAQFLGSCRVHSRSNAPQRGHDKISHTLNFTIDRALVAWAKGHGLIGYTLHPGLTVGVQWSLKDNFDTGRGHP
jgi:hypothetical protein